MAIMDSINPETLVSGILVEINSVVDKNQFYLAVEKEGGNDELTLLKELILSFLDEVDQDKLIELAKETENFSDADAERCVHEMYLKKNILSGFQVALYSYIHPDFKNKEIGKAYCS